MVKRKIAREPSNAEQLQEEEAEESEAGLPPYLESPSSEEEKIQAIRIAVVRALFRQTGSASYDAVLEDRRVKQYCGGMTKKQLEAVLEVFSENFMICDSDDTIALLSIDVDDTSMLPDAAEKDLLKSIGQKKQLPFKPKARPTSSRPGGAPNLGAKQSRPIPVSNSEERGEEFETYLHEVISNGLSYVVPEVSALETTWSPDQMSNRISKYIFKAASKPELSTLPWKEATKDLVNEAMQGYSASCGDKIWFYELDLVPTFCAAANVVIENGPNRKQLYQLVAMEFEDFMDRALLEKGMWEAVEMTFGDEDGKTQSKLFRAMSSTYWQAFDEVFMKRQRNELKNVEAFIRQWIKESMGRAWVSLEDAEALLTEESVSALFSCTVAPFGQEHPYSCIPLALCASIGVPPPDWEFVETAAAELVHQWHNGGGRKRRKTGDSTW